MRATLRIACTITLVTLISALPATADAAAKKVTIRPNALVPSATHQDDSRLGAFNAGGGKFFWAPLKLPVGAKITGLSYRRIGDAGAQSNVAVHRVQPGKVPAWQELYNAISTAPAGGGGLAVTGTFVGPTKKVVAGWDHFVLAFTQSGAAIGDVTVKYETP